MDFANLNWLDIVFWIAFIAPIVLGIWKGFVRQLVPILGLVLGFALASRYYPELSAPLGEVIDSPKIADATAFATIFFATSIVLGIVARLLERLMKTASLGGVDKTLGGVLGFAKGIAFMVILAYAIVLFAPQDARAVEGSRWMPVVIDFAESTLWPLVPEDAWKEFLAQKDALKRYLEDEAGRSLDAAKALQKAKELGESTRDVAVDAAAGLGTPGNVGRAKLVVRDAAPARRESRN